MLGVRLYSGLWVVVRRQKAWQAAYTAIQYYYTSWVGLIQPPTSGSFHKPATVKLLACDLCLIWHGSRGSFRSGFLKFFLSNQDKVLLQKLERPGFETLGLGLCSGWHILEIGSVSLATSVLEWYTYNSKTCLHTENSGAFHIFVVWEYKAVTRASKPGA